ncbi:MAG TPA: preprotein translocase subunit YajC [Dongiaceae bacterium]|nr:preprotein translocase subunit YajC [Dongiaceae bacterium]
MFIDSAYAQAASGSLGSGSTIVQILPLIAIAAIFYFMMIRPQQKKMKDHRAMVAAVKRGDRVVTSGGIIGVISKVVDEAEVQLEIAEGVRVRILRSSINDVLTRSEPAKAQDNAPEKKEKGDGR